MSKGRLLAGSPSVTAPGEGEKTPKSATLCARSSLARTPHPFWRPGPQFARSIRQDRHEGTSGLTESPETLKVQTIETERTDWHGETECRRLRCGGFEGSTTDPRTAAEWPVTMELIEPATMSITL